MTKNKSLTPEEILRALIDGKELCDDVTIFKFEDDYIQSRCLMDLDSKFVNCGALINQFLTADLYIYTPPVPRKNLLERLAYRYGIKITYDAGHIYSDKNINNINSDELLAWLDCQPESRLIL